MLLKTIEHKQLTEFQNFSGKMLNPVRSHPLSMYAKFSEKLTFPTPWYTQIGVHIRGLEILVFLKILHTYLMDSPFSFRESSWEHFVRTSSGTLLLKLIIYWNESIQSTNIIISYYKWMPGKAPKQW